MHLRPDSSARAYAMLAIVMLFWSGNALVGRAVRDDIPPFTLAFVRWAGALLILAPLALRHVKADRAALKAGWRPLLFLGLVGVAAFNALLYSGLQHTSATNGLLLQALIPPLVLAFGAIFFRDKAPVAQILGVLLSMAGVAVILFRGDLSALAGLRFGQGDGLVLAGCVAWALYTSFLRKSPSVHPLAFLFTTFLIGAIAMAPLAMAEALSGKAIIWKPGTLLAFGYVAVFPSVLAYFLYNAAVARIGPGPAGQTISLMPLLGAFLAATVLGERLETHHATGMALIMGGIALTALAVRKIMRG